MYEQVFVKHPYPYTTPHKEQLSSHCICFHKIYNLDLPEGYHIVASHWSRFKDMISATCIKWMFPVYCYVPVLVQPSASQESVGSRWKITFIADNMKESNRKSRHTTWFNIVKVLCNICNTILSFTSTTDTNILVGNIYCVVLLDHFTAISHCLEALFIQF